MLYDILKYLKGQVEYVSPNRLAPAMNSTGHAANIWGFTHKHERQAVKGCDQTEYFFSNRMVPVCN